MSVTTLFNPPRFVSLLKLELYRSRKALFITSIITLGLLFTGFILENIFSFSAEYNSHSGTYTFFLLMGGFFLSSLSFNDFGYSGRRYNYLMLPASSLEKFVSMLIFTTLGWMILFTVIFALYAAIANSAGQFIFRNVTFQSFSPLDIIPSLGYYVVFQSIFMVGAVHFRGYAFAKTLFTLLLFGLTCGLVFYLLMAGIIHTADQCPPDYNPFTEPKIQQFITPLALIGKWILAPVCWVLSYTGLKEQEV